jgi:adenine phosphoribosyltransferase
MKQENVQTYRIKISDSLEADLPLITFENGFKIYSFDMMGETKWNKGAALELKKRLENYSFDIFVTAEAKAIALTQELASLFNHDKYVILRKSKKLYMQDPIKLDVKSITTEKVQQFYIGREKLQFLTGKRVCLADDVVSTGGTIDAFMELSKQVGFTINVIACVLTEGEKWSDYKGIPLISLDHIPLP